MTAITPVIPQRSNKQTVDLGTRRETGLSLDASAAEAALLPFLNVLIQQLSKHFYDTFS